MMTFLWRSPTGIGGCFFMFYFDYGYHYISYQVFGQLFLCTVYCTLYTVPCKLYTVYWVLCTVHLNNFIKKPSFRIQLLSIFSVHCVLSTVHYTYNTVHRVPCTNGGILKNDN